MDKVKPFINCLHPRRVLNPYTKEYVLIECGKCKACMLKKASSMSLKCQLESLSHKFCMFVTLTFDNDNIPLAFPYLYSDVSGEQVRLDSCFVSRPCEVLNDIYCSHDQVRKLQNKFNLGGFIPFLDYSDIQLFMKRFRRSLERANKRYYKNRIKILKKELNHDRVQKNEKHKTNLEQKIKDYELKAKAAEKIRYYCCGELGPVHFRPHWHILFWFDEQTTLSYFAESLRKSWTYGRVDYSLSRGSCASYCASYVNSFVSVPEILKSKAISPKQFHSTSLGCQVFSCESKEIYKQAAKRTIRRSCSLNGVNTDVFMWRSLKAKIMPKCKGFDVKSLYERIYSYTIYDKIRSWTGETSPYKQAKIIQYYYHECGLFGDEWYHTFPPQIYDEIKDQLLYLMQSIGISDLSCPDNIKDKSVLDSYQTIFNTIYNELRVSKQFIEIRNRLQCSTVDLIHYIDKFYKDLDYECVKLQYMQQIDYLDNDLISPKLIKYMYVNPPTFIANPDHPNYALHDVELSKLWMIFTTDVNDRYEKSIKHKRQNDANQIFLQT